MNYAEICEVVDRIRNKYDEPDPFRLCRCMGIFLMFESLGKEEDAIKGFFLEKNRIRTIIVNSDLPRFIQKIIVAHEIGHAELHRESGVHAFHDVVMYDSVSVYEKEANLFAAEYLLSDEDVLEALNQDSTFFTAASQLMVPPELLDFKFRVLKWKGYKITESPVVARNNFLKNIKIPQCDDFYSC